MPWSLPFCRILPFLVFNGLDHPTAMAVPVATVKLVDDIGAGIVSVDWIGTDLLFFSSIQLVPDV
jgi:hypothetical protein